MRPETLKYFSNYIEAEIGIIYSEFNQFQLQARLEELAKLTGLESAEALHEMALKGLSPSTKQLILDIATNNETSFFRDIKLFQSIENKIIPELIANKNNGGKVRIWSAACSSGQEPYSLAMLAAAQKAVMDGSTKVEITATDISTRVLERAKKGTYSQLDVQRGMTSPLLLKHFNKQGEADWGVKNELRNMIKFEGLNLLKPFSQLGQFDLILCRNVLIYQSVKNKMNVLSRMESMLRPGGYLVMGAGESMIGLSDSFVGKKIDEYYVYQGKPAESAAA